MSILKAIELIQLKQPRLCNYLASFESIIVSLHHIPAKIGGCSLRCNQVVVDLTFISNFPYIHMMESEP